jgi:pimeloyl-ACP methyl ester carboxylesterase
MCRNRTHPTPKDATTVLKTAEHTSTHSLPIHYDEYLWAVGNHNTDMTGSLIGGLLFVAAGGVGDYHGFKAHSLTVDGCECTVVEPKTPANHRHWIWRMEFFDHRPEADLALLASGYHLAYMNVGNTFGSPKAINHLDKFYLTITRQFKLNRKVVLEGFSRGGLYAYNFAAKYPGRVAAIYGDAPVLDFKSWPGGRGKGPGSKGDWADLLKCYEFANEQDALEYKLNPVDNLRSLAKAKIPILHVIGGADEVVPVEENSDLVESLYRALGGFIQVIRKPGGLHHPHSLDDPQPIVEFILKNSLAR